MQKKVLFIHGAGDGAYAADKTLAESLQSSLGVKYDVRYPEMSNEQDAVYKTWVRQIKQEFSGINDSCTLVGHSVGASVIIKLLCEEALDHVAGIFLVSTPFWGGPYGWKYEGYQELVLPPDADSKLSIQLPLYFYHGEEDDVVPFTHLSIYANTFPHATIRTLAGKHQVNNDLSIVAKDIKATV